MIPFTLDLLGFALLGAALAAGAYFLVRRARGIHASRNAEEQEFELAVLGGSGAGGALGSDGRGRALPVMDSAMATPAMSPPMTETPAGPVPRNETELETTGPRAASAPREPAAADVGQSPPAVHSKSAPSTLGDSVTSKLEVAGLIECVEGPVVSRSTKIVGTVLKLRGGKLLAVLEGAPPMSDPEFDLLFRRYDSVVFRGTGEEPLLLKRFQTLISDMISL